MKKIIASLLQFKKLIKQIIRLVMDSFPGHGECRAWRGVSNHDSCTGQTENLFCDFTHSIHSSSTTSTPNTQGDRSWMIQNVLVLLLIFSFNTVFCAERKQFKQEQKIAATTYMISYFELLCSKNVMGISHLQKLQESPELINPITKIERDSSSVTHTYAAQLDNLIAKGKQLVDFTRVRDWAITKIAELERAEGTRKRIHEDTREIHRPMRFVEIPAGKYVDGITGEEFEIQAGIEIQDTLVTQWQWAKIMGENPTIFTHGPDSEEVEINGKKIKMRPDAPVQKFYENLTIFIEKLNQKDNDYVYRVPSVREFQAILQTALGKDWVKKLPEITPDSYIQINGQRLWNVSQDQWYLTNDLVLMDHVAKQQTMSEPFKVNLIFRIPTDLKKYATYGLDSLLMPIISSEKIREDSKNLIVRLIRFPKKGLVAQSFCYHQADVKWHEGSLQNTNESEIKWDSLWQAYMFAWDSYSIKRFYNFETEPINIVLEPGESYLYCNANFHRESQPPISVIVKPDSSAESIIVFPSRRIQNFSYQRTINPWPIFADQQRIDSLYEEERFSFDRNMLLEGRGVKEFTNLGLLPIVVDLKTSLGYSQQTVIQSGQTSMIAYPGREAYSIEWHRLNESIWNKIKPEDINKERSFFISGHWYAFNIRDFTKVTFINSYKESVGVRLSEHLKDDSVAEPLFFSCNIAPHSNTAVYVPEKTYDIEWASTDDVIAGINENYTFKYYSNNIISFENDTMNSHYYGEKRFTNNKDVPLEVIITPQRSFRDIIKKTIEPHYQSDIYYPGTYANDIVWRQAKEKTLDPVLQKYITSFFGNDYCTEHYFDCNDSAPRMFIIDEHLNVHEDKYGTKYFTNQSEYPITITLVPEHGERDPVVFDLKPNGIMPKEIIYFGANVKSISWTINYSWIVNLANNICEIVHKECLLKNGDWDKYYINIRNSCTVNSDGLSGFSTVEVKQDAQNQQHVIINKSAFQLAVTVNIVSKTGTRSEAIMLNPDETKKVSFDPASDVVKSIALKKQNITDPQIMLAATTLALLNASKCYHFGSGIAKNRVDFTFEAD